MDFYTFLSDDDEDEDEDDDDDDKDNIKRHNNNVILTRQSRVQLLLQSIKKYI